METIKIVTAKNAKGWRIINKVDMKPTDKLYVEKGAKVDAGGEAKTEPKRDALDHDGDGKKGGSAPAPKADTSTLADAELNALREHATSIGVKWKKTMSVTEMQAAIDAKTKG